RIAQPLAQFGRIRGSLRNLHQHLLTPIELAVNILSLGYTIRDADQSVPGPQVQGFNRIGLFDQTKRGPAFQTMALYPAIRRDRDWIFVPRANKRDRAIAKVDDPDDHRHAQRLRSAAKQLLVDAG